MEVVVVWFSVFRGEQRFKHPTNIFHEFFMSLMPTIVCDVNNELLFVDKKDEWK
jgi:hypothetical protein